MTNLCSDDHIAKCSCIIWLTHNVPDITQNNNKKTVVNVMQQAQTETMYLRVLKFCKLLDIFLLSTFTKPLCIQYRLNCFPTSVKEKCEKVQIVRHNGIQTSTSREITYIYLSPLPSGQFRFRDGEKSNPPHRHEGQ